MPVLAEAITDMWKAWGLKGSPQGTADDAIFAQGGHAAGSIADEFRRGRVYFTPAKKAGRVDGWHVMRRMLEDAGKPDKPGLYISRACEHFWRTVPYLPRCEKKIEDVDSTGEDHAADAVRYGILGRGGRMMHVPIGGI